MNAAFTLIGLLIVAGMLSSKDGRYVLWAIVAFFILIAVFTIIAAIPFVVLLFVLKLLL